VDVKRWPILAASRPFRGRHGGMLTTSSDSDGEA
jgi:hypothetical protein